MRFSKRVVVLLLIGALVVPLTGSSSAQATTKRCAIVGVRLLNDLPKWRCDINTFGAVPVTVNWNVVLASIWVVYVDGFEYTSHLVSPKKGSAIFFSCSCVITLAAFGNPALAVLTVTY